MRSRILLLVAGVVASLLVIVPAASAADAPPEIPLSIDKSQFQPNEVKVKANAPFVLVITNKSAKAAEFESKDLRVEKVVPAGKTVNVRIRALKPGTYSFLDDFNQQATGRIVAESPGSPMGGTFVITLREGLEAALIMGIVYTYLQKIGAERHYRYATRVGLLGGLASVALGVLVTALSGPLLDLGPDVIGLGVIFVAVLVLTWHGYWMQQHARAVKGDVQRKIDEAQASHRLWIIGVLAFIGVFCARAAA